METGQTLCRVRLPIAVGMSTSRNTLPRSQVEHRFLPSKRRRTHTVQYKFGQLRHRTDQPKPAERRVTTGQASVPRSVDKVCQHSQSTADDSSVSSYLLPNSRCTSIRVESIIHGDSKQSSSPTPPPMDLWPPTINFTALENKRKRIARPSLLHFQASTNLPNHLRR